MIGKTVLHYHFVEEIGRGSMGSVYRAEDTRQNRPVAIKFLPEQITNDDSARERFRTEVKAAITLDHPNITRLYAIEEFEERIFIVMEFVPGRDLKTIISEANKRLDEAGSNLAGSTTPPEDLETYLSIPEVVDIVTEVADALQYGHEKGLVHRKVKSANIMISEAGEVKLMDFGLTEGTPQQPDGIMGELAYMSPEQIRRQAGNKRSDVWSIGIVLYELLAGELPFQMEGAQALRNGIINETPILPGKLDSAIPVEFDDIITSTLSKEEDQRYASMTDFKIALNDKVETLPAFQFLKKNSTVSMKALLLPLLIIFLLLAILYFVTLSG